MTLNEAADATYIDLAPLPSGALVLGTLDSTGTFTQARVERTPHRTSRYTPDEPASPVENAVGILAAATRRADTLLCGWGAWLVTLSQRPDRRHIDRRLTRCYESAEPLVSEWAATYGKRALARTTLRSRGRAALHAMFELAGYRPDWDHAGDVPTAWRDRVHAGTGTINAARPASGPGEEPRRLESNRRDCLGLRHLVLRAAAEGEKRAAYLDSFYTVRTDGRAIRFEIGKASVRLDALLSKHGATVWAHISGCDPGLQTLTRVENRRRSTALASMARQRGYIVLGGAGQDRPRQRPAEDTCFIVGIPEAEARVLARQFGQWAIVTGTPHAPATLAWCLDPGADPLIVNQLATITART